MSETTPATSNLQDQCHIFSALPERYLAELQAEGAIRTYDLDEGDTLLFRKKAEKDEALTLLRGHVEVRADGRDAVELTADESACRLVPIDAAVVEVTAQEPAAVCRISRDKLDYLISWSAMLHDLPVEDDRIRERLRQLRYPAIFMNLPFGNVVKAFQRMQTRRVAAGEDIITQGERGDFFYVIESGRAEIWQQGLYDDEPQLVGVRVPGDHVGDEALVSGGTRNATVRMVEDGTLLVLTKDDFRELISEPMVQEVDIPLAKAMAERGYRWLDVRYEEEWEDGHIPEATLLPLTDIRERMVDLDREARYITYCLSGKRSAVAALILKANGFAAVCMKDGLREWPDPTVTD
jgi:rhodanese-related sulfurtransferase/signal-transduction protein with cAMP-binding, CBS, and nucleotidyltransferase domain